MDAKIEFLKFNFYFCIMTILQHTDSSATAKLKVILTFQNYVKMSK